GSPTVVAVAVTTGAATLALALVRRLSAPRRPLAQLILGIGVIAAVAAGYGMRDAIVALVDARADFSLRTDLWSRLLTYVAYRPVEGFGWFGTWSPDSFPFASLNFALGEQHTSALDAYLDVLLQLGWVGLLLFLTLGALALARGWLVATERRSTVHAWGPLTLVALLTFSLFESFTLSGAGLLLLVVCAVRAGQSRSWRESLGLRMPPAPAPHEGPGVQGPPTAAG
ncbi:O-antigen ligase family protein, partial [Microbacterium testaceum]